LTNQNVSANSTWWSAVSTGRTTQAEGYRPGLVGSDLVRDTYTFPIRKAVVRGEGFFGYTRFCGTYKWVAVEASTVHHCRKAVEALGVAPY
jgi:hypothetical protein